MEAYRESPDWTRDLADAARNRYQRGPQYHAEATTRLGYSSHFLEDIGNPMHTGRELDQVVNQWTHSNYENHIDSCWDSKGFKSLIENNNDAFWYTDWKQGAIDLATYSHGYLDTLYTLVYNLGPSWEVKNHDMEIEEIDKVTHNVLLRTAKSTNGLACYVRG